MNMYANSMSMPAAQAAPADRAAFIRKTYSHLAAALLVFAGLIGLLFETGAAEAMTRAMIGSGVSWLVILGGFMIVSWVANRWATSDSSIGMQYLGLGIYTVAEAIIFVPLLFIAHIQFDGVIQQAGIMTLVLFGGLTAIVLMTKSDFSFLGPILAIGGMVAIGVILCSLLFGFTLGTLFSGIMIVFAAGAILYDTSNVLHHYRTDQHVAASLSLFASVALLFWYILRFIMAMRD